METIDIQVTNQNVVNQTINIPSWWKMVDKFGTFRYFQIYEKDKKAVCDIVTIYSATSVTISREMPVSMIPILDCEPIEEDLYNTVFESTIEILNSGQLTMNCGEGNP